MLSIVMFVIGILLGAALTAIHYRRKHVGTLRIDTSDPSDGAYFFLEIEAGKADSIPKQKTILLTVNTENYISQG